MADERFVGIDFGTTNSALAYCDGEGPATLVRFPHVGQLLDTFRTLLFFEEMEEGRERRLLTFAGPEALDAYLAADGTGRLIQSIKSYLTSKEFTRTQVFGARFSLEELIGLFLRQMRKRVEAVAGPLPPRIVAGRPARFVGDGAGEALALDRLRRAYALAGFTDVAFEMEPIGAAYHVEARLNRDALVLVGDFGGGTSDFTLIRVGPEARARNRRAEDVLATAGLGMAGDAIDAKIVDHVVALQLGRDLSYRAFGGKNLPAPKSLYEGLKRWHLLSFLDSRATRKTLAELAAGADDPRPFQALAHIITGNRGFFLARAIESTKIGLSAASQTTFRFTTPELDLTANVARADFDHWIAPVLERISETVDGLLAKAGLPPDKIDRVFLTGGTSLIPAVQHLFAARFGAGKLANGDELTAVASGLALAARDRFRASG